MFAAAFRDSYHPPPPSFSLSKRTEAYINHIIYDTINYMFEPLDRGKKARRGTLVQASLSKRAKLQNELR